MFTSNNQIPGRNIPEAERASSPFNDVVATMEPCLGSTTGEPRPQLLVIGNGMVSAHLCKQLVARSLNKHYRLTVIGEEPVPAYDRVHLSNVLRGKTLDSLTLRPAAWYADNDISLVLGSPVKSCDLDARTVHTAFGEYPFDKLIFATGSAPIVPKLPGVDCPGVMVFRTAKDAEALRALALACTSSGLPAVVIGAGLLGLEAAAELEALGLSIHLVESAPHLMPRQLDKEVSGHLESALQRAGYTVHKGKRLAGISGKSPHLTLDLGSDERLDACLVVIAAGVRARDEVARSAGLNCDLFGGILVDDNLCTSHPDVYALGECARHRGLSFGLVAPGREMAEVLVRRLAGEDSSFAGTISSTRLKIPHLELNVVGESNVTDPGTEHHARADQQGFRKLLVRRGALVGAAAVGPWQELHLAQQAVASNKRISNRQLSRFARGELVWDGAIVNLALWPANAAVCACTGVTCATLREAYARGATSADALAKETGASTVCGTCRPLLDSLCSGKEVEATRPPRYLVIIGAAALLLTLAAALLPGVPFSRSVQTLPLDTLWREGWIKQLTGFGLVGLTLFGLLISLRKRLPKLAPLQRLSHMGLRMLHVIVGLLVLLLLFAHTGFRSGSNLDAWLNACFLIATFGGATAALIAGLERLFTNGTGTKARNLTTRWHIWATWPLPALVIAHVVKVYFF